MPESAIPLANETLCTIHRRHSVRVFTDQHVSEDEVLEYLGEPAGEFMAVVPIGYPAQPTEGPKKRPLEAIVKYSD